jgi:hypothetical protein
LKSRAPYTLRSVDIQSADRFGARGIGFVKIRAEIKNSKNESLPSGLPAPRQRRHPHDSQTERLEERKMGDYD